MVDLLDGLENIEPDLVDLSHELRGVVHFAGYFLGGAETQIFLLADDFFLHGLHLVDFVVDLVLKCCVADLECLRKREVALHRQILQHVH